jgi:homoserine O-acetyltransferase
MALDPAKYFIIIPNMLGNGLSSSPSNTPPPYDKARFPKVTACDNVRLQQTEKLGIERVRLVTGWSMGALQTLLWGALYPEMVERTFWWRSGRFLLDQGRQQSPHDAVDLAERRHRRQRSL